MVVRTVTISIGESTSIPLGRQGENEATEIIFDCSALAALYGEGAADVLHRRPGDEAPYPCAITQEGNTVRWVITSPDVARRGAGQAELRWYVEDTLAKSVLYSTTIRGALACGEAPPEPWKAWVDQVLEAVRTGGASAEQIAAAVEAYLAENPVEGLPGPAGVDGKDGVDGTDGYSPSVSVTQTDAGAVISITDQTGTTTVTITNGKEGEQGPAGVNGTDGKDGYTPVRGTDYWTAEDKQAIVDDVLTALPNGDEVSY